MNTESRIPAEVYPGDSNLEKAPEPEMKYIPVTGERYTDKGFMSLEWEHVWRKVWHIAGPVTDCAHEGDYFTTELGPESLLFVAGPQGRIQGFYNVCQHRGARLVLNEKGSVSSFSCLYHGWRYYLDGRLADAQDREDFDSDPCSHVQLNKIRTQCFAGFVWYCLDDDAQDLDAFLGPIKSQLQTWKMEEALRVEHFTVELPCNWKVVIDNFQEGYHIRTLHPQLLETVDENKEAVQYDLYPGGHSRMVLLGCHPSPNLQPPDIVPQVLVQMLAKWGLSADDFSGRLEQIRPALQRQKRRLADSFNKDFSHLTDSQLTDNYLYDLFPSCALSVYPEGEYIWLLRSLPHPSDPTKCLFDYWTLARFPAGQESLYWEHMDMTLTRDQEVEHKRFKFGEQSISYGIDQDIGICEAVQQGMASAGFKQAIFCHQERRVQFLHDNINRYIKAGTR
ncbi:Rieske 2Fe-2S domain-containing protein [Shewanella corallii]|uniref:Rieske 2Fe-2S domain-containing protein n=1 Tax=Shewanella corallii TaxID=560080 RepID=A0ABT0NAR8_9GAMM|nr:SRPBCC family protein [Shewanella corallii]MCL2915513.1 Rieske 2Fe-2S domain-containing protein [Shewanella corallii]